MAHRGGGLFGMFGCPSRHPQGLEAISPSCVQTSASDVVVLQVIAASLLKKVGFVHWVVLRGMLLPRALHHALAVLSAIGHAVCRPPRYERP
mmetsp:Transcript_115110/g.325264  ORF Transcript_115110/g.325264 Transcript_115110/m.325264 type:complete len:92 (-) Transcript_115110:83-358(-)